MKKICMISAIVLLCLVVLPAAAKETVTPMKPIAPLMIEHRLIERMVAVMEGAVTSIQSGKKVNPVFVDTVIDFFRIYGDKTHHGKEEDILFAALAKKNLSPDHRKMLDKLIDDHVQARKMIAKLSEANEKYLTGDEDTGKDILSILKQLTVLYRKHIALEDKDFFIPSLGYFSKDEMNAMLNDMREYDRKMIHIKYREVVEKAKGMAIR
jgi:hemerythrin-like domain-containing protein